MDYFLEKYVNTAFTKTGGWLQTLKRDNATGLLLTAVRNRKKTKPSQKVAGLDQTLLLYLKYY